MAMAVLFATVMAFSLMHMIRATDAIEHERSRHAVALAVQAEIDRIKSMADENAVWDDAVTAVYGGLKDEQFLWSSWGVATAESIHYDTFIILDAQRRPQLAYHKGRAVRIDPNRLYGRAFGALLDRVRRKGEAVGGLARTSDGLVLLSAAYVLPTSASLESRIPPEGPSFLVLAMPFNDSTAGNIGRALMLRDMRLSERKQGPGIILRDVAGQPVGTLDWVSPETGIAGLQRALPWILIAIGLHLLAALIVSRRGVHWLKQLFREALLDSLSGLPNRRAIRRELASRLGRRERVTLALIDLDGFKAVNDNYGHHVGDRLIKLVSELLIEVAGPDAIVARLGGDEFAVAVYGRHAAARMESVAKIVLDKLARPFRIDERTVVIGASIGLASAGVNEFDASELMRRADVAMYAAKRRGKMRLIWFDEKLDQQQAASHAIEIELRDAISAEDFSLGYQPVFDAHDGTLQAAEALLRWQSPTRGAVPAVDFIRIAEETGLLDKIGRVGLRLACRDALHWPEIGLAVNISTAQMRHPEFVDRFREIVTESGFPIARVQVEISEGDLLRDPELAFRVLSMLRAMGIAISLDNFGTGQASLALLRRFPFAKLKIHRSLVADAVNAVDARTIIQAAIAVAHSLDMKVVAEGVETAVQADLMRVIGCDHLQGWHFSRAVGAEQIRAWAALKAEAPIAPKRSRR